YPAIDDEMRDVDAFRRELARHALREATQGELSHRERRRLRISLDAGGRTREENRAGPLCQHSRRRALRDQERPESADDQGAPDLLRIERRERTAGASARVIDHDVG